MENNSDINILLLGETGVGKSSFINGLLNYLSFSTVDDAQLSDLKYAIPAQFVVTDENNELRTVKIGSEENESILVGESATQYPTTHVFCIEDTKIRLIDTPGIGDTRGIDVDEENFNNIIEFVSHYDHLNAVCILLKPNEARSDLFFRYCTKELFSRLHKNVKENVVFCFTNSRCTFYRPGDTMPALQKLLQNIAKETGVTVPSDNNVFCFDSESFRFLAALKAGIYFEDYDRIEYSKSWTRSVSESQMMIQHIVDCPVHDTKETIDLNEARQVLKRLTGVIAEIDQVIKSNETVVVDLKKDLAECELSIEEQTEKLNIRQMGFEKVFCGVPKLVCTHNSCIQVVTCNNTQKINYVIQCHPQCELHDIPLDTVNHVAIQNCQRMSNGTCTVCGHHWSVHMLVNYELVGVEKNIEDENIAENLNQKKSKVESMKEQIGECEKLIEELKEEQKIITDISVKFAHFIKVNAITVFNDDLENYLDHMIKEEQGKKNTGSNNDCIIDRLLKTKDGYKQQQRIFNEVEFNEIENLQFKEVKPIIESLHNLKHNGNKIREWLDTKINNNKLDWNEKQHEIGPRDNTKFLRNFGNRLVKIFKKI